MQATLRSSKPTKIKAGSLPTLRMFEPVQAGFPSPAEDYREKPLDLNKVLIKRPASTFLFRVTGDSMTGAGIHSGDVLVVDRAEKPKDGKVVVATVNGEWTVKRLGYKTKKILLLPDNPNHKPIPVNEYDELRIFGVSMFVIHAL
jgi:DNA polymerase V